jgi:N-acetylmuramoyl-L-alanine amidase
MRSTLSLRRQRLSWACSFLFLLALHFSARAQLPTDLASEAQGSHAPSTQGDALQVDLSAIRKIKVAGTDIDEAPLRVGNLDVLAPIVEQLPALGATATRAADVNLPDLRSIPEKDRPQKNQFFQINFPEETQNPPLVFAVGRSVAYIEKEPYTLRAAPLVMKGKLWLPLFSVAPLLAASPRLDASGTLNLNPTIQSVELFEVKGVLALTVKASAPIPDGKPLMGTLENPDKVYFDFPGFSMGFDAGNTTSERVVAAGLRDVDKVRAGLFEGFPDTTRVVLDLKSKLRVAAQPLPDKTLFAILILNPNGTTAQPVTAQPITTGKPSLRGIKIVVDAGHGGYDLGATGARSAEKNHNLDIARRVYYKLQAMGATASMTRSGDYFISLQGRVDFAHRQHADIFFSVHINSYTSSSSGTETYYYTPQSRALANEVHQELTKATGLPNRGVRSARFFVIRKTRMPSILTETAFISNPTEERLLMDENFRERVASAMARGIANYVQKYMK